MTIASVPALAAGAGPREASVSEIALAPASFDQRRVVLEGLVVNEFENVGLYESYEIYCGRGQGAALYAEWEHVPGIKNADTRRLARVEATFRNEIGVKGADGLTLFSTGAPGPGPLTDIKILEWLSKPLPSCK